jgi:hypothetical protein
MAPRLIAAGIPDLLPMERGGEPGCHISAIIRSLCLRLGHFEDGGEIDEKQQTRMELGCAFEDAVAKALAARWAKAYPDRYAQPGEMEKDGLIGTMDLLDVIDWAAVEIKLTWMSSRHEIESVKFWRYWAQLKAYCYMAETRIGRLHIGHINGNYRDDRGPNYNVWEDEFSKQALAENWRMLITHAEVMRTGKVGARLRAKHR